MSINTLVFKFPSVTSTQDLSEAIYSMINADKFVIVAEEQTKARGRYKREWYSPKGGLWFTYVIKGFNAEKIPFTTLSTALAVREALSNYVEAMIRWPNDVVTKKGKISGILVEGIVEGGEATVFIGVGINTNVSEFPAEIRATSILIETGRQVDNDRLLEEVIKKIDEYVKFEEKKIVDEINKYLSIKEKAVKLTGKDWERECKALFVDFMGRLVTDCGIFEVEEVLRVEEKSLNY